MNRSPSAQATSYRKRDRDYTPWVLVLADDLTGALEAGAKFADRGLKTSVTVNHCIDSPPQLDVLVIDTETRHLSETEAYNLTYRVLSAAQGFAPALIYKKTDSTLRGPIAAEFQALRAVLPERPLIYVPAYPEMGRTVRNGNLLVRGQLLHQTEFAHDLLNAVSGSDIRAMLNDKSVHVMDGETQEDVERAARAITATEPMALAAGPGALAGALADRFGSRSHKVSGMPCVGNCLVVNGSLHPASLQQILLARANGCFENNWMCFEEDIEGTGTERARRLGERVHALIQEKGIDSLIVFGGDTAFGIHFALGAPDFEPWGEILPGVPLSRSGNRFWITKAGGFGTLDILSGLQRLLS